MRQILVTSLALFFVFNTAVAHEYEAGDITIHHPYAYEVVKRSDITHAFMNIANDGDEDDVLLGASSPIASSIDIIDDQEKTDKVDVDAHRFIKFRKEEIYLQLNGIKKPIKVGSRKPITLHFKRAGDVKAQLLFTKIGEVSLCDDGSHVKKIKPKK